MINEFPFDHFFKKEDNKIINNNYKKADALRPDASFNKQDILPKDFEDLSENILCTEILNNLKDLIPKQRFAAFFENTFEIIEINENSILFSCSTNFIKHIISTQYLSQLEQSIFLAMGKRLEIILKVIEKNINLSSNDKNILKTSAPLLNKDLDQISDNNLKSKSAGDFKFTLDLNQSSKDLHNSVESKFISYTKLDTSGILIDPNKTFETFIVGNSNNLAHATALAVAKHPSRPGHQCKYQCLYIHSESGLGKTHLLYAVANKIKELYPNLVVVLITARDFCKEMVTSLQNKTIADFQKKYSELVDVLMIDDIHELKNKTGTQNEFFHIFNELHSKGRQLIFTSDKLPTEIDGIPERIRTRLQWGLQIDIQKPDYETKVAILKKKAYELDLFLPEEIYHLIASNISSSIRELEGHLYKLSVHKDLLKVEIDLEMAKDLLSLESHVEYAKINAEQIAKKVAHFFKVPYADLKSKGRMKKITQARHISMYLIQKHLRHTLIEIGEFFGGRDHTSVIHAIKKIESELSNNIFLAQDLQSIENGLHNFQE